MRKEGDRLIIEPAPPKSLLALLEPLAPIREDFLPVSDVPPEPVGPLIRYFFDTNIVSDLVRNSRGKVAEHIRKGGAQICTIIVVAPNCGMRRKKGVTYVLVAA